MESDIRGKVAAARRVIFDFDGTLVNSNDIKRRAFDLVFADYPEHMKEIQAYCHGFNHTIRGEKFKYVTERILGQQYTSERDHQLHEAYARYTTDAVAEAPEIPGAHAFLKSIEDRKPALVSSTPHEILLKILERRGWRSLFGEVRGAPVNKRDWLNQLRQRLGCKAQDLVFFGDTYEDEASAREAGCTFVRVGKTSVGHDELALQDFTCL